MSAGDGAWNGAGAAWAGPGSGALVARDGRRSGAVVSRANGTLVHAARRARAQLAVTRAAEVTLSCWAGDESLKGTHKNYNRFPCQRDE